MSNKISPFVQVTKETAPKLIQKLKAGEGSLVTYATLKNGRPTMMQGQSIYDAKSRQVVIDKITNYVNRLEQNAVKEPGVSLIAIA